MGKLISMGICSPVHGRTARPYRSKKRLAAKFTGWEKDNKLFEIEVEKVIKALQTEGAREKPPVSQL